MYCKHTECSCSAPHRLFKYCKDTLFKRTEHAVAAWTYPCSTSLHHHNVLQTHTQTHVLRTQRLFIHCTHKDHSCSTKTIHVAQTKAIHVAQTKTVHVLQTNMTDTAGQSLWLRGLPCCNHHNESSWCGFDPRQGSVGDSSRCSKQVLEHRDISACLAFVCTAHNSHCKW